MTGLCVVAQDVKRHKTKQDENKTVIATVLRLLLSFTGMFIIFIVCPPNDFDYLNEVN